MNLVAYTYKADCTIIQANFYIPFPLYRRKRSGTIYRLVPQQESSGVTVVTPILSLPVTFHHYVSEVDRQTDPTGWSV